MREMNITKVLSVLKESPDSSFAELQTRCGLEKKVLESALQYLVRTKHAKSEPVRYSITMEGVDGLREQIAWRAQAVAKAERVAAGRLRREQKRLTTDGLVQRSIRKNPNSVFALGATNA